MTRSDPVDEEVDLSRSESFVIGSVQVRPSSREVVGERGRVVAEPRALQVLVALTEARGAVMSRDALVRRCWGGRAIGEDAIQRAVAKARHLAELSDPPAFAIESIPRVGYRLAGPDAATHGKAPSPDSPPPLAADPPRRRRAYLVVAGGAAALGAIAVAVLIHAPPHLPARSEPSVAGPVRATLSDPATAVLFVQARDDWAQRTRESLARSIGEFGRVTRLAPDFAPAFADLADAYLLAGEVGSLPEEVAFDGAQHAAARALALDPGLAGAHRASAFILYWRRHDPAAAGAAFREAIRLDPDSAQTHFWYANALADNGEDAAARREFDRARLGDPGSDQIGADYAWALWIAGRSDEAAARLHAIVARNPAIAEAQDCLAVVVLEKRDYAGFLQAREALARLRSEPELTARTTALAGAFARGGGRALLAEALALEREAQQEAAYPDRSDAAFYASLAGDRAALMEVLRDAEAEHEVWGSAGYVRRIAARWRTDAPVLAALASRTAPPMEPSATGRPAARS